MARLEIEMFGAPRVLLDDRPVHFPRRKALALLLYLALQDRPPSRETLGALFWPESADSRNQVRVALSVLRTLLGSEWFNEDDGMVSLATLDEVWVDVLEFKARSDISKRDRDCVARLTGAVALVQGDFLEGFTLRGCPEFDDWQQLEGQTLGRETEIVLRRLIDCLEAQGDLDRAIHFGNILLTRDDLNESTYRMLMRLYAQNRQLHKVRRIYDDCVDKLQADLGVRPSRETESLYRQIVRARHAYEMVSPQAPVSRPPTAIPYYGQPFFGRREEQTQVLRLLGRPECRLLTILGTGGIGKTHLVAKVSEHIQHLFSDGIYFVPLETLTDGEQFLSAIAAATAVHVPSGAATAVQILAQLKDQSVLLILDNLEHLLPEAKPLIAELLQHTSKVKVLATSRVRLQLHGEFVVPLVGLNYPPQDQQFLTVQDAKTFHSVQLFVHWAQKRKVSFDLTPDNVGVVAALCATLQGVPLAVRLAAAWCDLLGVHELLAQVRASFELLQDELGDVPERHRSARALFNSVWTRLDAADRRAFLALSVFRGGFTRQAARDIADVAPTDLKSLLDKSLLTVDEGGRYHIHRILRFFASEKLLTGSIDRDRLQRRYVAFYADFLRERTVSLQGAEQLAVAAEIDPEYRNIQHAWQLAITHRLCKIAETMIEGFLRYVQIRGYWVDGLRLFAQLSSELESGDEQGCQRLKDKFAARSYTASYSQLSAMAALLRTAKRYEDQREVAYLTYEIGCTLRFLGWYPNAQMYFARALDLYEELSDDAQVATVMRASAHNLILADEFKAAQVYAQRSLEISQKIGDRFGTAEARDLAAELALMQGDLESAIDHLERAYLLWKTQYGERSGLVQARLLPWCYFFAGQLEKSESLADHLLLLTDRETAAGDYALTLRLLCLIASVRENLEKSQSLMEQSETLLSRDDVMTLRSRLRLDHNWHLLLECAAAIIFCLNREFERSKSITARLLGLKMTHLRPFIIKLLFTTDVLALYLQGIQPVDGALVNWLKEQKWLRHVVTD